MKIMPIKLVLLLSVFAMFGCSHETASVDGKDIHSSSTESEGSISKEVTEFIADLNENLSDMSSFGKGSHLHAATVHGKDGDAILTVTGTLFTEDADSDESEKWSVNSNDLVIGLITVEASKSKLFSGMKWVMNVNEYRIEGSRTFPHDPGNDYQRVVAIR